MKEITWDELLAQFAPSYHRDLERVARLPGTTHLVMFENRLMDSSACGDRTALAVGPQRSVSSLTAAYAMKLGQAVSDMQIPVAHARVPA